MKHLLEQYTEFLEPVNPRKGKYTLNVHAQSRLFHNNSQLSGMNIIDWSVLWVSKSDHIGWKFFL